LTSTRRRVNFKKILWVKEEGRKRREGQKMEKKAPERKEPRSRLGVGKDQRRRKNFLYAVAFSGILGEVKIKGGPGRGREDHRFLWNRYKGEGLWGKEPLVKL